MIKFKEYAGLRYVSCGYQAAGIVCDVRIVDGWIVATDGYTDVMIDYDPDCTADRAASYLKKNVLDL